MSLMRRPFVVLAALLLLALGSASPVPADQTDSRLDALFEQLKHAADPGAARELELAIWRIWSDAGNPRLQQIVDEGTIALSRGQFDRALESFNAVVEQAPNFSEGWNKRATLFYLMRRFPESIADIERTLALEPRHFGALAGLGLVYLELDDEAAALEAFSRALAINPNLPGARKHFRALSEKFQGLRT